MFSLNILRHWNEYSKLNHINISFKFNKKRVNLLSGSEAFLRQECKSVAYYMHRDQRVQDNWAMLYAQKLAMEHGLPLHVIAMIRVNYPDNAGATLRHMQFSLGGLEEVSNELKQLKCETWAKNQKST